MIYLTHIRQSCQILYTKLPKNVNSAYLSVFPSMLASAAFWKAKFCYSIQGEYSGNYNSVAFLNIGDSLGGVTKGLADFINFLRKNQLFNEGHILR